MPSGAGKQPTGQGTEQNGNEGTALDQRVAADEFVLAQVLGQDGVLDRPEQRRMQAEQEKRAEQHIQAMPVESKRRNPHDRHFQHLDEARQHRLVVLVGELPGGGRKEEERQDEDPGREVGQQFGRQRRPAGGLKSQQDDQRILEQVVVEGAQKLGDEEGREAPRPEQRELRAMRPRRWRTRVVVHTQARSIPGIVAF